MSDDRAEATARRTAVVLLAAGRGARFGGGKLAALLTGRPLAHHAAAACAALPFAHRFVVRTPATPSLDDFGFVPLDLAPPDAPLSRSIAIGTAAARATEVDAILLALADMPFVPAAHLRALLAAFDGDRIGSCVGDRPLPPAVFARRHFGDLLRLTGDRGAQSLLRDAPHVELSPDAAVDIDTIDDLDRARGRIG
jgi:molybdenum cofactor cytidylyltransferase